MSDFGGSEISGDAPKSDEGKKNWIPPKSWQAPLPPARVSSEIQRAIQGLTGSQEQKPKAPSPTSNPVTPEVSPPPPPSEIKPASTTTTPLPEPPEFGPNDLF